MKKERTPLEEKITDSIKNIIAVFLSMKNKYKEYKKYKEYMERKSRLANWRSEYFLESEVKYERHISVTNIETGETIHYDCGDHLSARAEGASIVIDKGGSKDIYPASKFIVKEI